MTQDQTRAQATRIALAILGYSFVAFVALVCFLGLIIWSFT